MQFAPILRATAGLCSAALAVFWLRAPVEISLSRGPAGELATGQRSSTLQSVNVGSADSLPYLALDAAAFEKWLMNRFPVAGAELLAEVEQASLQSALDAAPGIATRAALVLARSREPASYELLLQRLEARHAVPARWADAPDQAAAAALARSGLGAEAAARLLELADGQRPHPDLEVRTECAIAALALGERGAIRLLLRVLRIDTPSANREGLLTDSPTTAWPRGRAALALCKAAGLPAEDWSDSALSVREAAADRLESLLLP